MVMGSAGSGTFNGAYEPGGGAPMELEASLFTDPATKNSADLAIYAANAWNSGWGYVWGTFGQVLTPELLQYKISQYPEGVGDEADFIRSHWLNRRTTDCVGAHQGVRLAEHRDHGDPVRQQWYARCGCGRYVL